ncbi:SpoIIE family protein phosphatase [Streptomyces sp. NPDC015346]|uniref:SpoIIE family protein phosphatase n=1 Tax=Streptomyces sp. NPDC015346 TaxID=3364954 RepID=UPI0036FF4B03
MSAENMGATEHGGPFDVATAATVVLDAREIIIGWSPAAEALFGYPPGETLGRPVGDLLADAAGVAALLESGTRYPTCSALHRDGHPLRVALAVSPLGHDEGGATWLVAAVSTPRLDQWAGDQAMLNGLSEQSPIMISVLDTQLRVKWINRAVEKEFGLTLEECRGQYISDVLPKGDYLSEAGSPPPPMDQPFEHVLNTGEPLVDLRYRSPTDLDPFHYQFWSSSYFRLEDVDGRPLGVCETAVNITDRYVVRQRLALLSRAGGKIGQTLNIERTAGDLAELTVPEFAAITSVDLFEPVLRGEDPGEANGRTAPHLRRMAERAAGDSVAGAMPSRLAEYPAGSPQLRCLSEGRPVVGDRMLAVPLRARGTVLGLVTFQRFPPRDTFDPEEVHLAEELVSRTAVCVDNGRRYVREHAAALMLQRDLLPRRLPEPTAVSVAHRYRPAAGPVGVGGDWYDVIPLSGARVGLVIGDVAGRGLRASATMGRMRTTVAALAALDLAPEELLARLDDLVVAQSLDGEDDRAVGVTCLYAIYDPVERHCVMARAGHLPPALVTPDGRVEILDLPAGPPLGLGGLPFESAGFDLPENSLLALFTDGLVESREQDIDVGLSRLRDALSRPGRTLEETGDSVLTTMLPHPSEDDAALLLARVHALSDGQVASWDLPADFAEVARFRGLAVEKAVDWGHDEAAFVVELVVSELVTNALRYGGAPMRLRLIRDQSLICEVSDGGHTSPHLRRAGQDEEGGRGLFLVAQLTERWGTRYTPDGKTIWAEVPLSGPTGMPDLFDVLE